MNDAVNVRVGREDLVEGGLVGDVHLVELGALARDELHAVDALLGGIVQVVDDDDLVAGLEEGQAGEGTDVTDSTLLFVECQRENAPLYGMAVGSSVGQ